MTKKRKAEFEPSGRDHEAKLSRVNREEDNTQHGLQQIRPTSRSSEVPKKDYTNAHRSSTKSRPVQIPDPPEIKDERLLKAVFVHQGTGPAGGPGVMLSNYEALEFLGDAYLELIATKLIFDNYLSTPGRMSKIREMLVKNETLAEFTTKYGFDQKLILGQEDRLNARLMTKIKGDVFEAYIGAVIKSDPIHGYDRVEKWLIELWAPILKDFQEPAVNPNAKAELNTRVLGNGARVQYEEERPMVQTGGGQQTCYIGVYVTGWGWTHQHLGSGTGSSKTSAGCAAATEAMANPLMAQIVAVRKAHFDTR